MIVKITIRRRTYDKKVIWRTAKYEKDKRWKAIYWVEFNQHLFWELPQEIKRWLPTTFSQHNAPNELQYADDADFVTQEEQRNHALNSIFNDILLKENLKSNTLKTDHIEIGRGNDDTEFCRNVKKLVSLLGDKQDLKRRKQLSVIRGFFILLTFI